VSITAILGAAPTPSPAYVAGMAELPQLTPPGEVFAYNNAAVVLTRHVIERIAGQRTKTSCARGCWTR